MRKMRIMRDQRSEGTAQVKVVITTSSIKPKYVE